MTPEAAQTIVIVAGVIVAIVVIVLLLKHNKKQWLKRLASLSDSEYHDILDLWRYRFVLPRATGQTIQYINAEVQNRTDKRLYVVIHPGTYFISSGNYQNMVTTSSQRFTLRPKATERIYVPAACINANLPIPGKSDSFHGVAKVSPDLTRFLEAAHNEDAMVIQAGVWAITDGYSGYAIQNKLYAQMSNGTRRPAISTEQIAQAKRILDRLSIANRL